MRLFCAAALSLVATPAIGQDPVKMLAGNTLTGVYQEGSIIMKLGADRTVSAMGPDGKGFTGHWIADDQYLCIVRSPTKQNAGIPTRCERVDLSQRKIGESWKMVDSYGHPATVTITRGH